MAITINSTAGKAALDTSPPQQVFDLLRAMAFGHLVRAMPTPRRGVAPSLAGVNPYVAAANASIILPDDAKAHSIFRAYGRASGSAALGPLTVANPDGYAANGAVTTKNIEVAPTGDIMLLGTDLYTSVDLLYLPEKYDVVELTIPVTTANTILMPTTFGEILFLLEVQAVTGTTIGTKIVDPPLATAPVTAGHASLDLGKLNVLFTVADAVTSARVKFAVAATIDIDAFLTSTSVYF